MRWGNSWKRSSASISILWKPNLGTSSRRIQLTSTSGPVSESRRFSRSSTSSLRGTFFQKRSQDFRDFEKELGDHGNQVLTEHLVQYANLYSEIADEEDVEVSHDDVSIALMDKSGKRKAVLQILGELEEEVTGEVQQRGGLA